MSPGNLRQIESAFSTQSVEMSPGNLRQIESAFSTHRDDYANFETAVEANTGGCSSMPRSPITPIIITEDYSKEPVTVEEYQEEQFQGNKFITQ